MWMKNKIMKILFIVLGTISLLLGIIGIIIPGLPTTTFLLLTAGLYVRSSQSLYLMLIRHKILGAYIRSYKNNGGMTYKSKFYAIAVMWIMILVSIVFAIQNFPVELILIVCGIIGTTVIILLPQAKPRK